MAIKPERMHGDLGWEEVYPLGELITIPNGDVNCRIIFCITARSLEYWYKKYYPKLSLDIEFALTELIRSWVGRYQKLLLNVLAGLIRQYRGFPSSIHKAEELYFCFDKLSLARASVLDFRYFKIIRISYDVDHLNEQEAIITNVIKHELFHIVSQMHEGEERTTQRISKFQDKLAKAIEQNKRTVDEGVKAILFYCGQMYKYNKSPAKEFEHLILSFYEYSKKNFWNLISDSALCVIAIELDDIEYIRVDIKRDQNRIVNLTGWLRYIINIWKHIMKKESDERKRNFSLSTLKLLQFILCFNDMPYNAIAYAILGDDWRPKKKRHFVRNFLKYFHRNKAQQNIDDFESVVKKYCHSEVAEGFLRFYDDYLHIIDAQAIHNYPLDPNITQQIHNTECLKRGIRAYATLNREFYKLFRELKSYENK